MDAKAGSIVKLKCEECSMKFTYKLTRSPFRKKLCDECAATRTYENKRRFDEKRKNEDIDEARARVRKAIKDIPDFEVTPNQLINAAMKMVV